MGKDSAIEWCHHTFNPWWGCARVSPGCEHCYAETFAARFGVKWGVKSDRRFFGDKHWNEPLKWNAAAQKAGERHRVFCASMADVFEDRDDLAAPRARLYRLVADTPHLDWLLLTKRIENAHRLWTRAHEADARNIPLPRIWLPNTWLGATAEDQDRYDKRAAILTRIPAAVRFLSVEPMLGPVKLKCTTCGGTGCSKGMHMNCPDCRNGVESDIDWVIVGGESGHGSRPMQAEWARDLRDQCVSARVTFLFKQWGEHDSGLMRIGKKAAGRELDGRTWDEYPVARK
jgi:protein gp37